MPQMLIVAGPRLLKKILRNNLEGNVLSILKPINLELFNLLIIQYNDSKVDYLYSLYHVYVCITSEIQVETPS